MASTKGQKVVEKAYTEDDCDLDPRNYGFDEDSGALVTIVCKMNPKCDNPGDYAAYGDCSFSIRMRIDYGDNWWEMRDKAQKIYDTWWEIDHAEHEEEEIPEIRCFYSINFEDEDDEDFYMN